ncbi:MAG: hypothetical protein Q8P18_07415 [Pseudomonadota bacterium]|nr:hypothetical protein [Pseudomonadota bacterium]
MLAPLLLLLATSARADAPVAPCAAPVPTTTMEAALSGTEAAWGIDEQAFRRGVVTVRAALPCLGAPLASGTVARVHRMEGLAAFLDRDAERTTRAFAAARALEPAYTFPTSMIPAQNPVRVAYDAAVPGVAKRSVAAPARSVTLWVDGAAARALPGDRAALVQVQAGDGPLQASAWVLPEDPLPDYRLRGEGLRVPVLIGAGALAAGAGVLWALGASARGEALDPLPLGDEERAARQDTANGLGAATVAVGATAAATGVSAFLFARW